MIWEEAQIAAIRGVDRVASRVRFAVGEVCVVEVTVDGGLDVRGEGRDLFDALASARRVLEPQDVMLVCNGARRDVFPSPMLRQAAAGRRAYVLDMPRTSGRPSAVDIFAAAPESAVLATVDEQREWFERWRKSEPGI